MFQTIILEVVLWFWSVEVLFTLLCYEDIFDCLEDCVQEQCCKGETFQTVTLEVVLWFCILFWLGDVSVVDDWEDFLRCCVMMIFWWSRRLCSRTMWKRWGSHQTITLEVLFLLFARWNCRHSSGLDAVVEVFISFQQIPCTNSRWRDSCRNTSFTFYQHMSILSPYKEFENPSITIFLLILIADET